MGVFSSRLDTEVRLERMRPAQLDAAMRRRPAIYVPFGSIEWHGRQNPVGLDATKAHEQLVGLAARIGGVVHPPVFFSSGGGHGGFPHSFMYDAAPMRALAARMLQRFEEKGFQTAILLSGHYPNKKEYLAPALDDYRRRGGAMRVLAIVENEPPGLSGDHAAKWETSYQLYLHPETVDMNELAGEPRDLGGPEEIAARMSDEMRSHPCYGICGIDPRAHASAEIGRQCVETLLAFLAAWVEEGG